MGWILLYGAVLIIAALFVGFIIALFVLDPNSIVARVLVITLIAVPAVIFLAGVDRIKHRVASARYFRSLPKIDTSAFRRAFPEFEERFLIEVRRLVASHFRIDPDKVSSELYLGGGSALGYLLPSLYESLFKHFRPVASPAFERMTEKTARPRPAHAVNFPEGDVNSLHDLLREIDRLKHLAPVPARPGSEATNPGNRALARGLLTKSTDKMSAEEFANLERRALVSPIARWISKKFFSYDQTPLQTDLAEREVQVCHMVVERVAIGVEWNDEGPIIFLDAGTGEVLFLVGQWMCQGLMKVSDRAFADWDGETSFFKGICLRRAPRSGLVLSLEVTDSELVRSERSIPHKAIWYLGESCFVPGSLDTLEANLRAMGEAKAPSR